MIRIIFRNLEESELARDITLERLHTALDKFPDLKSHRMSVTISMENSRKQAGPDLFKIKLVIEGRKYGSVVLEKEASNFYVALADLVHHTHERLSRCADKRRSTIRRQRRQALLEEQYARGS